MAIEIKELVIKMTLIESPSQNTPKNTLVSKSIKKEIIEECVAKVMELLTAKLER